MTPNNFILKLRNSLNNCEIPRFIETFLTNIWKIHPIPIYRNLYIKQN